MGEHENGRCRHTSVLMRSSFSNVVISSFLQSPIPLLLFLICLLLSGCELFSPRTPEDPISEGGTFVQPDTPDQVIENLQAAIGELNTLNYRRSLDEMMAFTPTPTATARDPALWQNWSRGEEEGYFNTLVAAAQFSSGHELRLNDQTVSVLGADRYVLDATYVLTVQHRRTELPTTVQGKLIWVLTQSQDGLWRLAEWTDQELGSNPSWSDLKAGFIQ